METSQDKDLDPRRLMAAAKDGNTTAFGKLYGADSQSIQLGIP
jgi:hypothetical protein